MTPAQIIAVGLIHLLTPGPQVGWPHNVQQLLDKRVAAAAEEDAAEWGSREHRQAQAARVAAEWGLVAALDVPPRVAEPLDIDDAYLAGLFTARPTT
ncbi:hypothetical protein [Kitasatospora sp. NPDC047058]|uniref:hypothetical protein n=1 Tax=Kitasatospora sp. NPDC047058 TaxID=3155620 RepID=UPI0033E6C7AD